MKQNQGFEPTPAAGFITFGPVAFIAFTAGKVALIRVAGTRGSTRAHLFARAHGACWSVAVVAGVVVAACIAIPSLQSLFQFEMPPARLAVAGFSLGVASALLFDLAKLSTAVQQVLGRSMPKTTAQRGEVM